MVALAMESWISQHMFFHILIFLTQQKQNMLQVEAALLVWR